MLFKLNVMNKHRLKINEGLWKGDLKKRLKRDMSIRYSGHIEGCIDHLDMAVAHLEMELGGRNELGMVTNIKNARFEIKRHFYPERVNNECGN